MKKPRVVIPDWALGGAVTVLLLLLAYFSWSPLDSMELKLYDLRAHLRTKADVGKEIIIAAIDESSIETIGRWPWPRSTVANAVDIISEGGAKVIGLAILYTEPEQNPGLAVLKQL